MSRESLRFAGRNGPSIQSLPDRRLSNRQDLEWMFVLTLPNGGSTALAKLLLTAPKAIGLTDNAEGQWLVPEMSESSARWDPTSKISYGTVRTVWLDRIGQLRPSGETLVIEKSPPNLCRHRRLLGAFVGMKTYLVTFARDPYATISSWHTRYGIEVISREWDSRGVDVGTSERAVFQFYTRIWLERARMLVDARRDSIVDLSYESFCDDPASTVKRLQAAIPLLHDVKADSSVKVKDYPSQAIEDMNQRQIDLLSDSQIAAVSQVLATDPATMESLGYRVLG